MNYIEKLILANRAKAAAQESAPTAPDTTGLTYNVSPNMKKFVGTSNDDVFDGRKYFNAPSGTFITVDKHEFNIDGGDGTDTYNFDFEGSSYYPSANNVEILNVRGLDSGPQALHLGDVPSVVQLTNLKSNDEITVDKIANKLTNIGYEKVSGKAFTVTIDTAALAGSSDKVDISIKDISGAGSDLIVQPISGANGYEEFDITVGGTKDSVVNSISDGVTATSLATIKIAGDKKLTITTPLEDEVVTVNASAMTAGGISLTAGSTATTITGSPVADTITGGDGSDTIIGNAGDDTITGGGGADTITGGAGADTIIWTANTAGELANECATSEGATSTYAAGSVGETVTFVSGEDKLHFKAVLVDGLGTQIDTLTTITKAGVVPNTARFVHVSDTIASDNVDTYVGAQAILDALDKTALGNGDSYIVAMDNDVDTYLYHVLEDGVDITTVSDSELTMIGKLAGITAVADGDFVSYA